ncbi:MAG: SHOCT domain-containing protein [Nitrospinota bacterium]
MRHSRWMRGAVITLWANAFLFLLSTASLADPGRAETGPWEWHPMWGWGMWGFGMGIMMLIFWAAVIVGVVALVRWLWTQGQTPSPGGGGEASPLDIAKRRYASGEITKEEFEALKRDLS